MKKGNKAFVFLLTVCLMAVSFAIPAAAAEIPKENYTFSVSKQSGEVKEKITLDDFGDIYKDLEITATIVPENTVLTFTPKVDMKASVSGYILKDGIMVRNELPWTINGKEVRTNDLKANTTVTVNFSYGLPYYELFIWDEATENTTIYYFKAEKGAVTTDQPDAWAKAEVDEAIAAGLVPTELRTNYKQKITRADFSKIIIKLLEVKTGQTIDEILLENEVSLADNPFTDTAIKEVIAANLMGIVNGKGNGKFDPNGSITRQEAAIMLTNTAEVLGYETEVDASAFADSSSIASWAKPGVDFVFMFGIMKGTDSKNFSPKGTYTRQQAYITIGRLDKALE
ncbi:S-layer homology domain-containing protein [Bacillus sp. FJAT-26390]|uniref:S-layer homology domain-containing protein n=1 Tax=Bacillus sp. FJAT-26390 TaxID=1743142 RepID=UPI000807D0B5|nr:S-layer homology domain-containing protein [Bacillus sp. FJAT-26390]OBZ08720.1 hypothetical protein A7975_27010 [Bacillus sp. FJAT-26390]